MSRTGYGDCYDARTWGLYEGARARALAGNRGQALLRDLEAALDAMPEKRLSAGALLDGDRCCSLGAVALHRDLPIEDIERIDAIAADEGEIDRDMAGRLLNIAPTLVASIAWQNDEGGWRSHSETDEQRWTRMRAWAVAHIKGAKP
jgi:hypothetical protein